MPEAVSRRSRNRLRPRRRTSKWYSARPGNDRRVLPVQGIVENEFLQVVPGAQTPSAHLGALPGRRIAKTGPFSDFNECILRCRDRARQLSECRPLAGFARPSPSMEDKKTDKPAGARVVSRAAPWAISLCSGCYRDLAAEAPLEPRHAHLAFAGKRSAKCEARTLHCAQGRRRSSWNSLSQWGYARPFRP